MALRRVCLAAVLCLGLQAEAAEVVHFESAVVPPSPLKQRQAEAAGKDLAPEPGFPIWGHLSRPDGDGPFPALVLMHGCAGLFPADFRWAALLTEWGYVTLIVDSFRPRSVLNVCEEPVGPVSPMTTRPLDAHGALAHLRDQPFVDPDRIGVVGWSHGGISALAAVSAIDIASGFPSQFRAAATFYPYCLTDRSFDLPVLILIGEVDDWTPYHLCQRMAETSRRHGTPVELAAYPGAAHSFDIAELQPEISVPGAGGTMHRLAYDEAAHKDATARLKSFLAENLARRWASLFAEREVMGAATNAAADFARDGFCVLRGHLDAATVARARGWCDAVLARWRAAHPDAGDVTNMAWLTEPRWRDDRADLVGFLNLIAGDGVLALLTEIGAPPLFNNTQYFPEPRQRSWPGVWHRDCQFLFPARDDAGEARIRAAFGSAHVRYALTDEACLEVVPGSHRRVDTPAEAAVRWDETARTGAMPGAGTVAVAAGDVVLLHAWALHRGHYRADEPRRTLDVIWQWGGKLDDFVPPPTCFADEALLARLSPGARAAFARYLETYAADWDAGAHAWAEAAKA